MESNNITFDVYDADSKNGVVFLKTKLYKLKSCNHILATWIKRIVAACESQLETNGVEKTAFCYCRTPLSVLETNSGVVTVSEYKTMIGIAALKSQIYSAARLSALMSCPSAVGYKAFTCKIYPECFEPSMVAFGVSRACARLADFCDERDTFFAPDNETSLSKEFIVTCVIYSLFDSQNMTTSISAVSKLKTKYCVVNHFFPYLHKDFIKDDYPLYVQNLLSKAKKTFVAEYLERHASEAIESAKRMLTIGKQVYQLFFDSYVNIDFNDICLAQDDVSPGWYQIKRGLKGDNIPPDVHAEFKMLQKQLQEQQKFTARYIADKAYEYGFLAAPIGS